MAGGNGRWQVLTPIKSLPPDGRNDLLQMREIRIYNAFHSFNSQPHCLPP